MPRDSGYEDRLKDYTDVKERIRLFYAKHPDGRLVTDRVEYWLEVEPPRIVVAALAYRTPDDPLPGKGWSWMILPGTTNFTRGSEIENTETSAWGRAIGSLGIGIGSSIASAEEVAAKAGEEERKYPGLVDGDPVEPPDDGSLIGNVGVGAPPVDMQLRAEPDGTMFTGFVLRQGRQRLQVVAVGPLADAIQPFLEGLVDKRVSVWGRIEMVPWRKGDRDMPPYKRLQLARIKTDDWILPAVALEAVSEGSPPDPTSPMPALFPEDAA
jgi:hypothetical protein